MPLGYGYTGRTGDFYRGSADPDPAPYRQFASLDQVVTDYLLPEFDRASSGQSELEKLYLQRLNNPADLTRYREELGGFAESIASELFAPGGQVEQGYRQALGQSVGSGFGTTSGGVTNAQNNILGGARDVLARAISQGAIDIAGLAEQSRAGDIANLLDAREGGANRRLSLLESIYGAQAGIEQLGLTERTQRLNERLVNQRLNNSGGGFGSFLGKLGGGLLGSALGPLGATLGAGLGGEITGALFGGGEDQMQNPYAIAGF